MLYKVESIGQCAALAMYTMKSCDSFTPWHRITHLSVEVPQYSDEFGHACYLMQDPKHEDFLNHILTQELHQLFYYSPSGGRL